mgnify:FL=1
MYLARKIDHDLYLWHYNTNDVLVVQGPPCVGKTTSIQHYVKENFAYYYIIDLEDKIGKKFSKKFSKNAQNSKDFSPDLSQDGDTHELQPIFSFIYKNEGALDDTKNSVLIIKNLQFSKDPIGLIKYLNQFDFRLICTLESTLAKYSNIVCSPYTYIVRMTGFTFQEFLGLYEAEEDYITIVDGIGVQEAQAEVENEERNEIWFADALDVYQNVGCYPEVVETYYNNGDYCNEIYDQILKVCKTIARREDVREVFVYKVLTSIVWLALAQENTFTDLDLEVWELLRCFSPEIQTTQLERIITALIDFSIIKICPIYNLKKEKISTKKYKIFFTEHAVFRTLAKLQGIIDWEDTLMDNFIYSTIHKAMINYRHLYGDIIQCVVKKKRKGKGKGKSIGFLIKSESGHLHKFITTSPAKVPSKIAEHANISKYYEESSPLFSKWNGAEPSDCEFLPLFSLAQTVLDNIDGIEISLPELN